MSPSLTQTSFAVAGGAGGVGTFITEQLVAQGATTVAVLSRTADTKVPAGATVRVVNYDDEASVAEALKGIEVVVSALSAGGLAAQPALANAAKKAGVKLFVPSEYGVQTDNLPEDSLLYGKTQLQHHLKSLGVPYLLLYIGFFSDWTFVPFMGFDVANKKITIIGAGNKKISFTARNDVAHYLAYVLTHIPAAQLAEKPLRIEGDKKTWEEVVPVLEEVYGGKFEVVNRDAEEVKKSIKANGFAAIMDYILILPELGLTDVGANDNALVPGFKPLNVKESLLKYFPPAV